MSSAGTNVELKHRVTLTGAPVVILWIVLFSTLPFAAILGGMSWLLIALAPC